MREGFFRTPVGLFRRLLILISINKYTSFVDITSAVVPQSYTVNVMDEAVLRGNTAILKCHIPSFVADFVFVSSWVEDETVDILPGNTDNIGISRTGNSSF